MTQGIARIVSGGQTGADRAALDVAIARGITYGGWCPKGGLAEDHGTPPGLLAEYPRLRETATADPAERTRLNVRDSDATLVVRARGAHSPGTDLTVAIAGELGRPLLVAGEDADAGDVHRWLARLPAPVTLNVAGPRASEDPAAYATTRALLEAVVSHRTQTDGSGAAGRGTATA